MIRKINIVILIGLLSICYVFCLDSSISYAADTGFMDGSGTEEDPYLISSKKQLDNVRYHKNAHFKLVADIKFTKADFAPTGDFYNEGHGWRGYGWFTLTGINSRIEMFTGTFDGNGHVIDGLYQNVTNDNIEGIEKLWCNGLFGSTSNVTIKNLALTNVDLRADTNVNYAVGLAAFSESMYDASVIDNCYISGEINLINRSGGVAGGASGFCGGGPGTVIKNCHNDANVTVTCYTGIYGNSASGIGSAEKIINCYNTGNIKGICTVTGGEMEVSGIGGGDIDQCYNIGSIYSSYDAGGICGGGEHIQNSYNRGYVYGAHKSGGIMGNQHTGEPTSCTEKCYNVGQVECGTSLLGAIIGGKDEHYETYLRNCYYLDNIDVGAGVTYTTEMENLKKCTSDEMKYQDTFIGFDFDDVWVIDRYSGYEYPVLKNNRDILAKRVKSVSLVDDSPEKITTSVGIEPTYPKANVRYADDSVVVADLVKDNFKELNISQIGTQVCKLYYAGEDTGLTVTFEVKERIATSFNILSNPIKTEYVLGQPLNLSGGKISVNYDNGTSEEINMADSMVEYDKTATGNVEVTVKVDECTAKYNITVNNRVIDSISVKDPDKLNYYVGDEIDITGGKVVVIYQSEDYYSEEIEMKSEMISEFDSTSTGIKAVKVTYEGFESSFSVNIKALVLNEIKVTTLPTKLEYVDPETFDATGMVVTGYYNSGKEEPITGYEVSGFGDSVDKNTITIKMGEKTDTFDVTIHKASENWDIHESSCTEDGYKALLCSGCGKELKRETIVKTGHNLTAHEAKTVTCTEAGSNAYWSCDRCNKYFSDAEGNSEVENNSWIIQASGHHWDKGVVTKDPTETEKGIKTFTCTACKETKTEEIPVKEKKDQPSTSSTTNPTETPTEAPTTTTKPTETPTDKQDDQKPSNPANPDEGKETSAGEGVGTISSDGTILTDTNGVRYYVSAKVKTGDLKNNLKVADKKSGGKYKITKVTKKKGKVTGGTVTYMAPYNKNCTKATASNYIKIGGVKFKITAVNANAFKGCTKLKSFTAGENITTIGKNAFRDCKNLKTFTIKSLSLKSIGANSFKGVNAKIRFKVPKKKLDRYERMIRKAGAPKSSKITK